MALTPPDGNFDPNTLVAQPDPMELAIKPPNGAYTLANIISRQAAPQAAPAPAATPTVGAPAVPASEKVNPLDALQGQLPNIISAFPPEAQASLNALMLKDPSNLSPGRKALKYVGMILAGLGDIESTQQLGIPGVNVAPPTHALQSIIERQQAEQDQYLKTKAGFQSQIMNDVDNRRALLLNKSIDLATESAREKLAAQKALESNQVRAFDELGKIIQKGGDTTPALNFLVKQAGLSPKDPSTGALQDVSKGEAMNILATSRDPQTGDLVFMPNVDPTLRSLLFMGLSTDMSHAGHDDLVKLLTNPTYAAQLGSLGVKPTEEYGRIKYGLDRKTFQDDATYNEALAAHMSSDGTMTSLNLLQHVNDPDVQLLQGADLAAGAKAQKEQETATSASGAVYTALQERYKGAIATDSTGEANRLSSDVLTAKTPEALNAARQAFESWGNPLQRNVVLQDKRDEEIRTGFVKSKEDSFTKYLNGKVNELGRINDRVRASDLRAFVDGIVQNTMKPLSKYQDTPAYRSLEIELRKEAADELRKAISKNDKVKITQDLK